MFWRRKQKLTEDLKTVTEIAGDQIAPGVGTYALILGGLAVAAAGAYVVHQKRKNKKAALSRTASSKLDGGG
ncbi:MAG: hypothetical protein JO256_09090 [Alphaproteobacteria bacterium]|nr:hypothetical protein [Alphaproteobacteria bacterium]